MTCRAATLRICPIDAVSLGTRRIESAIARMLAKHRASIFSDEIIKKYGLTWRFSAHDPLNVRRAIDAAKGRLLHQGAR
jgi:hypothetical protein